jgi:cytochrome c
MIDLPAMLLSAALLAGVLPVNAAELTDVQAKQFINAKGCNACHGIQEQRLAPPFSIIAVRYAGAPAGTVDVLAEKIIHGGAGTWGLVPMVSNPGVTPTQARAIARWILDLHAGKPTR